MMENKNSKLIHIARIQSEHSAGRLLFLREHAPHRYVWSREIENGDEEETLIVADSIEEALRLARKEWKNEGFHTLKCGFRYTLPERDEHGINALFHQMIASYNSMNGVYFDPEIGSNCFVQAASSESRDLWQRLKKENKL
jgi:hypothetical protein